MANQLQELYNVGSAGQMFAGTEKLQNESLAGMLSQNAGIRKDFLEEQTLPTQLAQNKYNLMGLDEKIRTAPQEFKIQQEQRDSKERFERLKKLQAAMSDPMLSKEELADVFEINLDKRTKENFS
jgi:isopentenyl diphosphate isomerase/L-lactate dehydrogenase-like FMN-dependent dehydrogenase